MIPGPIQIYECPDCSAQIKNKSLISGNTFNATVYSDGFLEAPMLPQYPDLTRCEECGHYLWLSRLKEITEISIFELDLPEWNTVPWARLLTLDEYKQVLELGIIENVSDEKFVRMRIWWCYNDRIRYQDKLVQIDKDIIEGKLFKDIPEKEYWAENLGKLMPLLDSKRPEEQVLIAEIYRNQGRFDIANHLLKEIWDMHPAFDKGILVSYELRSHLGNRYVAKVRWPMSGIG